MIITKYLPIPLNRISREATLSIYPFIDKLFIFQSFLRIFAKVFALNILSFSMRIMEIQKVSNSAQERARALETIRKLGHFKPQTFSGSLT